MPYRTDQLLPELGKQQGSDEIVDHNGNGGNTSVRMLKFFPRAVLKGERASCLLYGTLKNEIKIKKMKILIW